MKELLPELKKRKAIRPEKYQALEIDVYSHLIAQTMQANNLDALKALWQDMPKYLRKERKVALVYIDG